MEEDEIRETRFLPGSAEDEAAFPRLVGDAIFSFPVQYVAVTRTLEGGTRPAVSLSLTIPDEERPFVASLLLPLARELHRALGEMLDD